MEKFMKKIVPLLAIVLVGCPVFANEISVEPSARIANGLEVFVSGGEDSPAHELFDLLKDAREEISVVADSTFYKRIGNNLVCVARIATATKIPFGYICSVDFDSKGQAHQSKN